MKNEQKAIEQIIDTIKHIVSYLLDGKYNLIIQESYRKRLTSEMVDQAIVEYPETLTTPPNYSYSRANIIKVTNKNEWIVEYFLWADNNESELMIKVVFEVIGNNIVYTLWDIYVP